MYDTIAMENSDCPTTRRTVPSLKTVSPRSWPRNTTHGSSATASTISGVTEMSSSSPRNHGTHFPGVRAIAIPASVPRAVASSAAIRPVRSDTSTASRTAGLVTIAENDSKPK